ncbi:hypothetical protein PGB90_009928 [Kerria lacca]
MRDKMKGYAGFFDARGRPSGKELHWSDESSLGPRAYFVTLSRPASLQLDNVQLRDEDTYRCRVDYRNAPTRNFQIHLTIIVPPHQIILYDTSGRELQNTVGPFYEGDDLILICEVRGGKPVPQLMWTLNENIVQNQTKLVESNVVVSKLQIYNLTRQNYDNTCECIASNSKLIVPTKRNIQLKLHLKPLHVTIVKKYREMIVNQIYTLKCESAGSRPTPLITWWKNNELLNITKTYENTTKDVTTNIINFVAKSHDNNFTVKCQALNPKIVGSNIEDTMVLNIVYPPMVFLELGNKLDSDDIKEGDDVYFECKNHANPLPHKIIWYRNNIRIFQNISSGIILSSYSLVLQSIRKSHSGSYTCEVTNRLGETVSNSVILRIKLQEINVKSHSIFKFKFSLSPFIPDLPICSNTETSILGASLDEIVHIKCSVIADPSVLTFKWIFNNSAQSLIVPKERYVVINSTTSKLEYKLTSNRDFGTLMCLAKNIIGEQTKPCTFYVIKAARPGAVKNCTFQTILKKNNEFLQIICIPGYSDGLPQYFHLEINRQNKTIANLTRSDSPSFHIELTKFFVEWQSNLQFIFYSSNAKGRGESTILEHTLSKELQTKMTIIAIFFIVILINAKYFKSNAESSCNTKTKLDMDKNDNKCSISFQYQNIKPDILNKVTEESQFKMHKKNNIKTFALQAPFSLITKKAISSQNYVSVKFENNLADTDDFITTFVTKNENSIMYKKTHNNNNSSNLTNDIFGPESTV